MAIPSGLFLLPFDGFDEFYFLAGKLNCENSEIFLHVKLGLGSRQRYHASLHGESKYHLLRLNAQTSGNGQNNRVTHNISIRRQ